MYLINILGKDKVNSLFWNHTYYTEVFVDLIENGVWVILFYKNIKDVLLENDVISRLNELWILIFWYDSEWDVIDKVIGLKWKKYIDTFQESSIDFVNSLKSKLWQRISDNSELFLDKYLQRNIIWKIYPELIVNYYKLKEWDELTEKYIENLRFPLIIKPVWWIESRWVNKVNNYNELLSTLNILQQALSMLDKKGLKKKDILIEEFVDWKAYSIDYFVDQDQTIIKSRPVYITFWIDLWYMDFFNYYRLISKSVEESIDMVKLDEFINKSVKWWGIRNTFIHHEFKVSSRWEFKSIEINWRIGWYRIELYNHWYWLNLLKFPFIEINPNIKLLNNMIVFAIYPNRQWILNWYNMKLIEYIQSLSSTLRVYLSNKQVWQIVGFAKDWFGKLGSIVLKNADINQFNKDVEFIEKNYFKLVEIW